MGAKAPPPAGRKIITSESPPPVAGRAKKRIDKTLPTRVAPPTEKSGYETVRADILKVKEAPPKLRPPPAVETGAAQYLARQAQATRTKLADFNPHEARAGKIRKVDEMPVRAALNEVAVKETEGVGLTRTLRDGTKVRLFEFIYDAGPFAEQMSNLRLHFACAKDGKGHYTHNKEWGGKDKTLIPMEPLGDGRWRVRVEIAEASFKDGNKADWGVVADTPQGKNRWAVFTDENPNFEVGAPTASFEYAAVTYHRKGVAKLADGGTRFSFWAPNAQAVRVKIWDADGNVTTAPLERARGGEWKVEVDTPWRSLLGKAYAFEVTDWSQKSTVVPDPYGAAMQGKQRGVDHIYMNKKTGEETHEFDRDALDLLRFEIQHPGKYDEAKLVFFDQAGERIDVRGDLVSRMQVGASAAKRTGVMADKLRNDRFNDYWQRRLDQDGSIRMQEVNGTYSVVIENDPGLMGLRYELQLWKDGKLVGAKNGKSFASDAERRASGYNDPWDNRLSPQSGRSFGTSLITGTSFDWRHDAAPRERDRRKWVVYQMHVGSFLSSANNTRRSTFDDVTKMLQHVKDLGANTIELLPINEFQGKRNWGYDGVSSLAVESSYGFVAKDGRYLSGLTALKLFVDEAHRLGLNVVNDVVYNHVGGNNILWKADGEANSWFNWSHNPESFEPRDTDWGKMPAFNQPWVRQFYRDHAAYQLADLHFDGLRLDFTNPIKTVGGKEGWQLLREGNRMLHFFRPDFFTAAEQFPYEEIMTKPVGPGASGGAGFDVQWYTQFQHFWVHDSHNPSVMQERVQGHTTKMDRAFRDLVEKPGTGDWGKVSTIISNHDEVGNADRTINVANQHRHEVPGQEARNLARLAMAVGYTSPGVPMFFMGDEFLSRNQFKWGRASTWDMEWGWQNTGKDWDWAHLEMSEQSRKLFDALLARPEAQREDLAQRQLSEGERQLLRNLAALSPQEREEAYWHIAQRQMMRLVQELGALRQSSPAFLADAPMTHVEANNEKSLLSYVRTGGNDAFFVVTSLNKEDLQHHPVKMPPGPWREVFNSNAARYGGNNFGNGGRVLPGGEHVHMNIPSGGVVVFKRQ